MTKTHIPVLAGELIDLVDPRPGEIAVDCTVGGGGHARLIADRIGPSGMLIGVDRDPMAEERFAALAAEVACETRFIRADFVTALTDLREERLQRRSHLSGPGDVLDAGRHLGAGLLLCLRRAAGHADGPRPGTHRGRHRQRLGRAPSGPAAAPVRRGALRLPDRPGDRPVAPARSAELHPAAGGGDQDRGAGARPVRRRPPGQAHLPGAADRRQRRAEPARAGAAGRVGAAGARGRLAAISFHSLEDRLVKRFLVARARGCVCPPEFPICVCGREPEAELLNRRAVAPTPGEVAANPRSKSAHLRAARKLEVTPT